MFIREIHKIYFRIHLMFVSFTFFCQEVQLILLQKHDMKLTQSPSILISRAEQGKFKSNLAMTSGCKMPNLPTLLSLTTISAHRKGKKVSSRREIKFFFIYKKAKWLFSVISCWGGAAYLHMAWWNNLNHLLLEQCLKVAWLYPSIHGLLQILNSCYRMWHKDDVHFLLRHL